jgi:hypothetical protein
MDSLSEVHKAFLYRGPATKRWRSVLQHLQRHRLGGRGKRTVERVEILPREPEPERSAVLSHMPNVGRLWNGNDAVAPEHPSEGNLSGLCIVSSRYAFDSL